MKSLIEYIYESDDKKKKDKKDEDKPLLERGEIKFTIWETPEKKVTKLKDNESYQKIEYKLDDKKLQLYIDFLLGYQNDSWKLWIGKIGSCSYDDDFYCDFETDNFSHAIVQALDKVEEFIKQVKDDPDNFVQFYKYL